MSATGPGPTDVKVSVAMITYNHARFIAQAIESALMQHVSFDYEIVIGEDCSADRTRDIVIDFQKQHPHKIRLLLPDKNLGLHGKNNFVQTLQACRGKYVALLEGDDYWTSPNKLQTQVGLLDRHPEYALCFHNVMVFHEAESRETRNYCPDDQAEEFDLEALLLGNFIPTCSVVFRRGLFGAFPPWFFSLVLSDWVLHLLNARSGMIRYIPEAMGVYRSHAGGVWSGREDIVRIRDVVMMYDHINSHLDRKYEKTIKVATLRQAERLAPALIGLGAKGRSEADIVQLAMRMFEDWPLAFPLSDRCKKAILAHVYAGLGLVRYQQGDPSRAQLCLYQAVRYDPSWLRNRGVASILIEGLVGRGLAIAGRKMKRRFLAHG